VGFNAAMSERGQGPDARGQRAEVVELLPSAGYRVRLENDEMVVAHAAGSGVKNFLRLRPGDPVRVELSPRDNTRGRIVELLKKG
jgi:translation initiation factor IF-1